MKLNRLVLDCLILIAFSKVYVNSSACYESAATATKVKSCPQNHEEWTKAAVKKGCGEISHACSSFEYHCVINAWRNETIEVCAPKWIVHGYVCAEYSQGGKRIQGNENAACKHCPSYYPSNESFKYQECYEYVKNANAPLTTQLTTESTDMESTTQEIVYSSSSMTHKEGPARSFQNIESQNTPRHFTIIAICVAVGLAAIVVVFTVKRQSWIDKIFSYLKRIISQSEESTMGKTESVTKKIVEDPEIQNCLLEKEMQIQDVFFKLNESSDNVNSNAVSS